MVYRMWEHTPTYLTTKRNRTMKNDNNETYREMEKRVNRNAWFGGAIALLLPVAFILFFNLCLIKGCLN